MSTWPPTPPTPVSMDEIRCTLREVGLDPFLMHARDDGAGCLIWTGYALQGMPQIRIDYRAWPVRRLLWELTRGPIKPGHQIGVRCTEPLCIHPDHLVSRTKSSIQRGKPLSPERKLKITMARRAGSKLTMDLVRQIRASDAPNQEIDRLLGMSPGYASRIRLGVAWADSASPFAGLGARA